MKGLPEIKKMPTETRDFQTCERGFRPLSQVIRYNPHFVKRWKTRNINFDNVEETINTGKIIKAKGRKRIFERYFGKENETYCVVCFCDDDFMEVVTVWSRKGR